MIASTGPGDVRYFQRAIGIHSGAPTRIGLYRCAPSGDPRGDEAFDPFARVWVPTTDLRAGRIAPQERVVEVAEYDARQFLLRTLTDGAAHALLSSPFRAPGPGAPPTPGVEPDGMRTVRASGQYVLLDGAEYESAHRFGGGVYPSDVTLNLYSSATGEKFGIAPSQVEGMANVRTHARHAGHWFVLGHLVTGEARVRGPVPFGAPAITAGLLFTGDGWKAVLDLPGARRLHDRPGEQTDEVVLDAPLAEIDDVAEERFVMLPAAG